MAGGSRAPRRGHELRDRVAQLAQALGLEVQLEVPVARRIWGARRRIDVVVRKPRSEKVLGIECKYQGTSGSAEEKIVATLEDIKHWPIPGIVVIDGPGFSANIKAFLLASGRVVEWQHLEEWLRLFFLLDEGA